MNKIEIWQPKYSTNSVLIATYKVADMNEIVFTKAKHLQGKKFKIDGKTIRECKIITNGKIPCYDVPMEKLILIG